jgi:glucosamine-6-phosphate deaminase
MADSITIHIAPDPVTLGKEAGRLAAATLREALSMKGEARLVLATGASQFATLAHLVREEDIDWGKVTMFHLDEYLGLPDDHPASFRRYLRERFVERVPPLKAIHFIQGDTPSPDNECARLNALIAEKPVDLALIGIGENGHLAFNDPPADMKTEVPYHIVDLDEACRRQQVGEGWFAGLDEVPRQAISMSVRQILKAGNLICSVPDARKADAVFCAVRGPVSASCPASSLQGHPSCDLFLDLASSSRL